MMNNDILFKTNDFIFSYRVGGILIHNDKILLQKPKDDDYAIIGGHVSALETTKKTLIREFKEEIHANIQVKDLIAVGEIFFPWKNKPCHQISLYYRVELADEKVPLSGAFHGYDELGNERIELDFIWVPLNQLNKIKVYPQELIPHLLSNKKEILHFESHQLGE